MFTPFRKPHKAIALVITALFMTGCGDGSADGGTSIFGGLKDFFIVPIKESVIAVSSGVKTASVLANSGIAPQGITLDDISADGLQKYRFDLTRSHNLKDCSTINTIENGSGEQFDGIKALNLDFAFAWSTDSGIPLYLPAEFSYTGSFIRACDLVGLLKRTKISITLDDLPKTVVLGNSADAGYSKATLLLDKDYEGSLGKVLQTMHFRYFSESGGVTTTTPDQNLGFARVIQAVSTDNTFRFTVIHESYTRPTTTDGHTKYTPKDGNALLYQKFTLVATDITNSTQYVAFFSSFPDTNAESCLPQIYTYEEEEGTGIIDYSYPDTGSVLGGSELHCGTASHDETVDGRLRHNVSYEFSKTPVSQFKIRYMQFAAVVDVEHGAYTARQICDTGKDSSTDASAAIGSGAFKDITSASASASTCNTVTVTRYDESGNVKESDYSAIDAALQSKHNVLIQQLEAYATAGQFPATIGELDALQGTFSADTTSPIDTSVLKPTLFLKYLENLR